MISGQLLPHRLFQPVSQRSHIFCGILTGSGSCRAAVVPGSNQGFDWWDEGRSKWGWWTNSSSPGASLTLSIPTGPARPAQADGSTALLAFGCTKSGTKPMGVARVTCLSGCACPEQEFDTKWDQSVSLTSLFPFQVSKHPECHVQFQVCPPWQAQLDDTPVWHGDGACILKPGKRLDQEHGRCCR